MEENIEEIKSLGGFISIFLQLVVVTACLLPLQCMMPPLAFLNLNFN